VDGVDDGVMGVGLGHHVAHIPQNEGRGGYCVWSGGGGQVDELTGG